MFTILLLFPFFDVKDISHFAHSPVFHIFKCGKDVFYDFLKSVHINWRKLSYSVTKQLINRVELLYFVQSGVWRYLLGK